MSSAVASLVTHLRATHGDRHPNLGKFLLWSNHVAVALSILREVEVDLRNPDRLAQFQKTGWWRRKRRANHNGVSVRVPNEDAITDAVVERIRQLQEDPVQGSVIGSNRDLAFHSQQRRRRQAGIGPDGLKDTDITAYRFDEICLDLRIEAKLVFERADLDAEYFSARGLPRFADPESPYTTEILGGMIAYCVSRDAVTWTACIARDLHAMDGITSVAQVLVAGEDEGLLCCDVHRADDAHPVVTVFHLGLEFDTEPVSRP
jgi:hypothetical protein